MMKNMRRGIPNLFKEGTKHRLGIHEAVIRNLEACKQLSDMTRTSLGPNGMCKMLINHLNKIFVTSDTATLLSEMEIAHPAAKMLVMASTMQESEIGDGSNTVIVLAGELLWQAESLLSMGLHQSEIISGYTIAGKKCLQILEELAIETIDTNKGLTEEQLSKVILAPMASKQYGYEQFLAPLVAKACVTVMPKNTYNFIVDNVRVCKVLGGSLEQSEVIPGVIVSHDCLSSVKSVTNARIAIFSESIQSADTETKGTVLIHNASELQNFSASEEKQIEAIIEDLKDSGVNVIITGGTVDEMAMHFIDKYGIMCLKTSSKFELRRLCKATHARPLVQLQRGGVSKDEQGFASRVYVREVGSSKLTIFEQNKADISGGSLSGVSTILLRASTHNILNDIERAIDDGVNTVRALTRDGRLLAGAGAVDIELARRLQQFASQQPGLEQYALQRFAASLEVVPRTLAENAGCVAMDILSQLYAQHESGSVKVGIDIENRSVKDMTAAPNHVYDLMILKKQAIALAVDAALTVLRVDSIIQAKPAGGPKPPQSQGNWDDDD